MCYTLITLKALFFTMINCFIFNLKMIKREGQGLSNRNCFINLYWHFTTAVQNRDLVDASTLFDDFVLFWQCEDQNIYFLASRCICLYCQDFQGQNMHFQYIQYLCHKSNSSHLCDTDWYRTHLCSLCRAVFHMLF